MKLAVTGAAGFIGSHLVKYLISKGHSIIAIDDLSRGKKKNLDGFIDKIEFHKISILDFENLHDVLEDVDGVFHQAALTSVPDSYILKEKYQKVNVEGTENIFKLAKNFGLKVVYASSSSVYGNPEKIPITENSKRDPINPYGETKLQDELLAERYGSQGTSIIGLRYFNVYGPGQNPEYAGVISKFHDCIAENNSPVVFGAGTQIRDFISVDDVAQANLASFESSTKNGFINIGSGVATSILDLAKLMIEISGKSLRPSYSELPKGDVKQSLADTTLAKRLINWNSKTSLKEGLEKYFFS